LVSLKRTLPLPDRLVSVLKAAKTRQARERLALGVDGGPWECRHPSVAILDAQVLIVGEPIGDLNPVTWVMGSASHGNAHECPYLPRTAILNATRLQNPNCIVG
jgi:hypothetical protein